MSDANQRTTLVVPTELERGDAFFDGAVLASVALATWFLALPNAALFGINVHGLWPLTIPAIVLAAIWTLTGEAITEVPLLGAIAAGVRRRLGLRRAHEWVLAYCHYLSVRTWPDLVARCARWARRPDRTRKEPKAASRRSFKAVLELVPTTNYVMASPREQSDEMESLARVLMGLSHRVQIVGRARPVEGTYDWPKPPQLTRSWSTVVRASDEARFVWRVRTVREAIEGGNLRVSRYICHDTESAAALADHARRVKVPVSMAPPVLRRIRIHPDCLEVDGQWCASMVLRLWPREVSPGWLGQALAGDELAADVGIHVVPQDAQRIARWLRKQQAWQTETGPNQDAANQLGKRDAEVTRQKLIARTDRPVKVAVVLTVWASRREELVQRIETMGHEIGLALGDVRLAKYEQDYGLEATEPNGRCQMLGVWRTLDCESVASTWILQPATVEHANGADLGTTRHGGMRVRLDPFDESLESFGGLIVAKVGAGKSFLLKLLARRLENVELYIVEQRKPSEYSGLPNAHVLNLADVPLADRARVLRDWIEAIWEDSKAHPRPKLLILDELWSLLKDADLAELVEEIARIGRHHWLSLWIATQQVRELLKSGLAVLDNAAIRIYLKQHDRDLDDLCDAVGLGAPARKFLRGAPRGHALLDCGGMLVAVEIQATAREHAEITTDPRERYGSDQSDRVDGVDRSDRAADQVPSAAQAANGVAPGRRDPAVVG